MDHQPKSQWLFRYTHHLARDVQRTIRFQTHGYLNENLYFIKEKQFSHQADNVRITTPTNLVLQIKIWSFLVSSLALRTRQNPILISEIQYQLNYQQENTRFWAETLL